MKLATVFFNRESIVQMRSFYLLSLLLLPLTQCAWFLGGAAETDLLSTQIVRISEEYANINTDLTGEILARHGIVVGSSFQVRYKDQTFGAVLGKNYSDVDKGEWVGLIEEDGYLQLAISFGNAATHIGCAVGDTLDIELGGN